MLILNIKDKGNIKAYSLKKGNTLNDSPARTGRNLGSENLSHMDTKIQIPPRVKMRIK